MPHISVNLYKGVDEKRKKGMTKAVQEALMEFGPWKSSDISVSFMELEPEKFEGYVKEKTEMEELVIPSDYIK